MFYCFQCPNCGHREERNLPMELRADPQGCACGSLMLRDKAAELRGTPTPSPALGLPAPREKSMAERVRSGEFKLARHFDEIGGPKIFE